ncbi:unnamed protein product [Pichia kudriavzevii]
MRIRLKAIGAIAQIHPSVEEFPDTAEFAAVHLHILRKLNLPDNQPLWCYVGNAFVPPMDTKLAVLDGMSSSKDILTVTYSQVEAFG